MRKLYSVFFIIFSFSTVFAEEVKPSRSLNLTPVAPVQQNQNQSAARTTVVGRTVSNSDTVRAAETATTVSRAGAVNGESARIAAAAARTGRDDSELSVSNSGAVRRAGVSLRPTVAEFGGRAIVGDSGQMTGSNVEQARLVTARATKAVPTITIEDMKASKDATDACVTQYVDCMDQFCNVIDANQKRCVCSNRLSQYTKVEKAVKEANDQLNQVAQRIRYVGLSATEIRAIMSATEAETEMSKVKDTTQNKRLLANLEKLIEEPGTFTTTASSGSSSSYDWSDLDFTDASGLDMFNVGALDSGFSFTNLRGTALYSAAKKQCETVLKQCKAAGATTNQVSGRYDMEIDKDCTTYENGLEKLNTQLKTNVRSATNMLQKARLSVLESQTEYDTKECISALNTCMTDDMVCGDNYYKCLDPTKKYINENGVVVLGQKITDIKAFIGSTYNNAGITGEYLKNTAMSAQLTTIYCTTTNQNDGRCIMKYLMTKMGVSEDVNSGLCRPVLDHCRQVAYTGDVGKKKYNPYNEVVVNYVQRAMVNIKAAQETIIAEYAANCMTDIAACYNQQVSQINGWTTSANQTYIKNIMTGACRSVALTCAYAVFADDATATGCPTTGTTPEKTCLENISNIFYQSLLCPDNSEYIGTAATGTATAGSLNAVNVPTTGTAANTRVYANSQCMCDAGYVYYGGQCITSTGFCSAYANSSFLITAKYNLGTASTKASPINYCECTNNGILTNGVSCPTS
ncbi:MAG: hypothetical protein LBO08_02595 [Rickettsiales bacterium]|nr:hypothetical protein [Rickettsiales bacterium]